MKVFYRKILFVFFISLVLCSEKYTLSHLSNTPTIVTRYIEASRSFEIPGVGYIQYAESYIATSKYLGEKDGFHIINMTMTEMKTDNLLAGIEVENYYWIAMNNIPCLIYVNSDGFAEHVEPVEEEYDYLQEAFERQYLNDLHNWVYPYGQWEEDNNNIITTRSIGESWVSSWDSVAIYINDRSPQSWTYGKTKFTLEKVKKKKSRNIAYISTRADVTVELRAVVDFSGVSDTEFIDGIERGVFEGINKWDLDRGIEIYAKETGYLKGKFEMGEKKFSTQIYFKRSNKLIE